MRKQCHYITRTYWDLRQEKPKFITDGVYELCRNSTKYNLRSIYFDENQNILKNSNKKRSHSNIDDIVDPEQIIRNSNKKRKYEKLENSISNNLPDTNKSFDEQLYWNEFNSFTGESCNNEPDNWVSATKVANYLLNDPVLDWYKTYFKKLQYNNYDNKSLDIIDVKKITNGVSSNSNNNNSLNILFEMGHRFEEKVVEYLKENFPGQIKTVQNHYVPLNDYNMTLTKQYMQEGVPIIEQAPLYNEYNKTFGVADLLVRSDWVNKIIDSKPISPEDELLKAPNLTGNYHYVVIDIKWTTMDLCADGKKIRNSGRFPAYKGQLAVYNAIIGQLQGYTPPTAYILAKSYKYTTRKTTIQGFNCFDILGHVSYSDFDESYITSTQKAVEWIRNMRSNGSSWSLIPPSVEELYPNMCNTYDSGYKKQKKFQSDEIKELTSIYMVGHKNRKIGHENGIYRYDDPNCKASKLGIYGKKVAPVVNQMIQMENDKDSSMKIQPRVISNDLYGWQKKIDIEFFVDFEMLNTQFYTKDINLKNSKGITDFLFMIGVGYEENNKFHYECFYADEITPECENNTVVRFIQFIEDRVSAHMKAYNIKDRGLCFPKIFHWSPAEKSTLKHVENRHNNKLINKLSNVEFDLSVWDKTVTWVDFCKVFREEPIILKGVKEGFGLKGIAKQMYKNGWIETQWEDHGPADGLGAMMDACKYYRDKKTQAQTFINIIKYNYADCKVVWEIVNYLRNNHANETFKQQRIDGFLADHKGDADDHEMMFPEAEEDNDD